MPRQSRGRTTALFTSVVIVSTVMAGAGAAQAQIRTQPRTETRTKTQTETHAKAQARTVDAAGRATRQLPALPKTVDGGTWPSGHLQGTAVDRRKGYMYFSFTDLLVKTDLRGKPVGSVTGFTGHLGDLDFNEQDGRVYGSLEYKAAKSFYIAVFDGDRVNRMNMDAESMRRGLHRPSQGGREGLHGRHER